MSSPSRGGALPPEVPEEYADAYRAAYERTMRDLDEQEPPPASRSAELTAPGRHRDTESVTSVSPSVEAPVVAARAAAPRPTHLQPGSARPGWVLPLTFALGALALIGSAYFLGRMVGGEGADAEVASLPKATPTPQTASPTPTPTPTSTRSKKPKPKEPKPWRGAVTPIGQVKADTDCTAPDGVDSSGAKVPYGIDNTLDGKPDTAWRCEGSAIGQRISFSLPAGRQVAEVGLIPGYAKTDAKSGDDRYAENNRITGVTWVLADGTEIEQVLSADPKDRSMRTIRVPAVAGDSVTLIITDVAKGERDTTMISEVRLAAKE